MVKMSEEFEDLMLASAAIGGIRPSRVRDKLDNTLLKIAGCLFPLRFKHRMLERHATMGQTDLFNNTVLIDGNLKESDMLSSIWHEILEVINKKYGLEMPHEILSRLETHTYEALINNPQFIQELLVYAKRYNGIRQETKKIKK